MKMNISMKYPAGGDLLRESKLYGNRRYESKQGLVLPMSPMGKRDSAVDITGRAAAPGWVADEMNSI